MAYNLHAVIGEQSLLKSQCSSLRNAKVVLLNQAPLALVPITSELQSELEARGGRIGKSSEGAIFERLTPAVTDWITSFTNNSTVAYVEAEFFGGSGGHCAVVWDRGQIVFGPVLTRWGQPDDPLNTKDSSGMAINRALRLLGVTLSGQTDEFDAAGLERCRRTENW